MKNNTRRKRPQRVRRVYLPKKKVIMLLSIIAASGIFLLFMHAVFIPLPSDAKTASSDNSRNSAPPEIKTSPAVAVPSGTAVSAPPPQQKAPAPPPPVSPAQKSAGSGTPVPPGASSSGRPPRQTGTSDGAAVPVSGAREKPPSSQSTPSPSAVPSVPAVKPGSMGILIFVIDDAGHNLSQLQPFLDLPFPVSIAVLPGLEYSVKAAQVVRSSGKELLLHQPMQAQDLTVKPGPAAILPGMTPQEITAILHENAEQIGPIAGINNHEGSLITADPESMGVVMEFCSRENVYFLDSRTTAESAAGREAAKRGIKIWERAVFLDNNQEKRDIVNAVYGGMEIAGAKGAAVMIGHVWSSELAQILNDMYPELIEQGFSLSTIARIASGGEDYEDIGN